MLVADHLELMRAETRDAERDHRDGRQHRRSAHDGEHFDGGAIGAIDEPMWKLE